MEHEPAAHEARRVGEPVGTLARGRQQEQPRRPDAVGRAQHHVGRLEVLAAVGVDPLGAGGETTAVDHDPARGHRSRAACHETAAGQCVRSVDAWHPRCSPTSTCRAARTRDGRRTPPTRSRWAPATSASPGGRAHARAAGPPSRSGSGGRRVVAVRVRGITAETRHAEVAIGALEEREQLFVRHRPVVAHSRERPRAEVRREQARPDRVVQHGAAADSVEVADPEVAARAVDRVVGRGVTHVRRRSPTLSDDELPLAAHQTPHGPATRLVRGTPPRTWPSASRRAATPARRAYPDDQDVCVLGHGPGTYWKRREWQMPHRRCPPCELKEGEHRVAITPDGARAPNARRSRAGRGRRRRGIVDHRRRLPRQVGAGSGRKAAAEARGAAASCSRSRSPSRRSSSTCRRGARAFHLPVSSRHIREVGRRAVSNGG